MKSEENIQMIVAVLRRHPETAGDAKIEETAREWMECGFDDPSEIEDWIDARCFTPDFASRLEEAGITPEQAAIETTRGNTNELDTLGNKIIRGTLSLNEARRIITSEFWSD
jgi:hypothetical protein